VPTQVTPYVALLRAVNVGGRNRVPMKQLREALAAEGLEDVATVLQSGNVLFRSGRSEAAVAKLVGATISKELRLDIGVVVRSGRELATIAKANPFLKKGEDPDPKSLHVVFLEKAPAKAAGAALDPDRSPPDAFAIRGRDVYLSYPGGSGRSKLTLPYFERVLGVHGTARNWRTVLRLAELAQG
jgi:uncharacterized protein (DUF1697 family)